MKTIKGLLLLLPLAASFPALSGEFSGKVIKLGIDPTFHRWNIKLRRAS